MTHKLTTKQKALVDTLVASGGSITDASKQAGYSAGNQAESQLARL